MSVAMLAGCGTRLSDSAFEPFQIGPSAAASEQPIGGPQPVESAPGVISGGPRPSELPSGGPGPGTTGNGNTGGPAPTKSSAPATGGKANYASDVGVTADTITLCNVVTQGGPFGPYQFTPSYYGAAAYFADLNAHGGINGRKVRFVTHPDDGSDSSNLDQIHTCIDTDKAFAFVANNIYQYAGAPYTYQKGVPDIGSQPISTYYYKYPNLFSVLGNNQPRNGKDLAYNGYSYRWSENSTYFKTRQHVTHVGVVYYDQASSQYGANQIGEDFRQVGVKVSNYQVNLGLPNFASAVAQMKADGVDLVADAVDLNGGQKLCQAIEQNSAFERQMKVHLSTISAWSASIGEDFAQTPKCLAKSWVTSYSWNFQDTSNPEIAKFHTAMRKYFPSWLPHLHQWSLEGWIGAMWFTDAARSCGADLTRKCLMAFMNRPKDYSANGLMVPWVGFLGLKPSFYDKATRHCVSAAQWSVSQDKWITRATPASTCFNVKGYRFKITDPT